MAWLRSIALAVMAVVCVGAAPVGAQATGSISVTVANCPPGMTSATLASGDCTVATEGFAVEVWYGEGQGVVLTLAEASFDGTSYTWSGLPLPDSPSSFLVTERALPAGYVDNVVTGDGVESNLSGSGVVRLTAESPAAAVAIYNFAEPVDGGQASLVLWAEQCPAGYAGDDPDRDCGGAVAGVPFTVGGLGPVTTNQDGIAELDVVPGAYEVSAELPAGIDHAIYTAYHVDGTPVTVSTLANGLLLAGPDSEGGIEHRDRIIVVAYLVPEEPATDEAAGDDVIEPAEDVEETGGVTTLPVTGAGQPAGGDGFDLWMALGVVFVVLGIGVARARRVERVGRVVPSPCTPARGDWPWAG